MTYLLFHLLFTIPMCIFLFYINGLSVLKNKKWLSITAGLIVLAVVYTTPWDHFLIANKVWAYDLNNILATVYLIPVEEYFFFIIQTVMGCLVCHKVFKKYKQNFRSGPLMSFDFATLTLVALAVAVLVQFMPLAISPNRYRYLALIIVWVSPIFLVQWFWGGRVLVQNFSFLLKTILPLTFYLWFCDLLAIYLNIWWFPQGQISGIYLLPHLPIEESLFFFVTNVMVVQGYFLAESFQFKDLPSWLKTFCGAKV